MDLEKQGAEREAEARAIAEQRAADLDHLLKNTHPSLRDTVSLGDSSNGTTQTVSDYAAVTLSAKIEEIRKTNEDSVVATARQIDLLTASVSSQMTQIDLLAVSVNSQEKDIHLLQEPYQLLQESFNDLQLQLSQLKNDLDSLRLKVVPSATPETLLEEVPSTIIEMPVPVVQTSVFPEIPAATKDVTP